jgi:hypothetical protein
VEAGYLGDALARDAEDAGAQAKIDAKYGLFAVGIAPTREFSDAIRAHAQAVEQALGASRAKHDYYNFEEFPAGAEAVLPCDAYRRLREIKALTTRPRRSSPPTPCGRPQAETRRWQLPPRWTRAGIGEAFGRGENSDADLWRVDRRRRPRAEGRTRQRREGSPPLGR